MKKNVFCVAMFGMVLAFGLVVLGCNKANAQSSANKKGFIVEGIKVTDDLNKEFKVDAEMRGNIAGSGGGDLGIVGNIKDGRLQMTIPIPSAKQLHGSPQAMYNDSNIEKFGEGMMLGQLYVNASGGVRLELHPQGGFGDLMEIWYANKDGDISYYDGGTQHLKQGWNFIENSLDAPVSVFSTLEEVYDYGHSWELRDW
ncbi:MAG: hypothetical protein Ta2B_16990 [Termitinemataceae bacterium]|nr:MAG: hypothetical protein Ta2B_16990 [Termitinemataceae bacterium]